MVAKVDFILHKNILLICKADTQVFNFWKFAQRNVDTSKEETGFVINETILFNLPVETWYSWNKTAFLGVLQSKTGKKTTKKQRKQQWGKNVKVQTNRNTFKRKKTKKKECYE